MTCKVDTSRLSANMRKIRVGLPGAREQALTTLGREFALTLDKFWPRDTNRSIRGWMIAANEAGMGPLPVPIPQASKYFAQIAGRLVRQEDYWADAVRFWSQAVRRHERGNRRDKWYRDAVSRLRFAQKRLARAEEELQSLADQQNAAIILIGGRSQKQQKGFGGKPGRTGLATLRLKIYGGRGRRIQTVSASYAELVNLEPHVKIVERKSRLVAAGLAQLRSFGLQRSSARFITELSRASEMVHAGRASFIR